MKTKEKKTRKSCGAQKEKRTHTHIQTLSHTHNKKKMEFVWYSPRPREEQRRQQWCTRLSLIQLRKRKVSAKRDKTWKSAAVERRHGSCCDQKTNTTPGCRRPWAHVTSWRASLSWRMLFTGCASLFYCFFFSFPLFFPDLSLVTYLIIFFILLCLSVLLILCSLLRLALDPVKWLQ